jgi:hypothetical protein
MMPAEARHTGRGLPLAIFTGILLVVLIVVAATVWSFFAEQSDEIAQSRQMLATYRSQIASRPMLEAQFAALVRRQKANPKLLQGASSDLAAANMQNYIKDIVIRHGGQVRSVQSLPSGFGGGLEKVAIQYDLSLPLGSLGGVAYDIETGMPLLFLKDVNFKATENWQPGGTIGPVPNIQVRWVVQGYRWVGGT